MMTVSTRKLMMWLICFCLLFTVVNAAADGSGSWYCPQCGRLNDADFNYCPNDQTENPFRYSTGIGGTSTYSSTSAYAGDNYTQYANVTAVSNKRIATRTGPGTQYDEPGSFYGAGTSVRVLSKAFDSRNSRWWVQVEFTYQNSVYWVYTGEQRFDNLNLSSIPEEKVIGHCKTAMRLTGLYAPSQNAAPIKAEVPAGVECDIYGYVYNDSGDFIQIEFYDSRNGITRRAWIQDPYVDNYEMYYGF